MSHTHFLVSIRCLWQFSRTVTLVWPMGLHLSSSMATGHMVCVSEWKRERLCVGVCSYESYGECACLRVGERMYACVCVYVCRWIHTCTCRRIDDIDDKHDMSVDDIHDISIDGRHFFDVTLVYTWNLHAFMCASAYVHVFICVHVHWNMTVYVYVFICVQIHWCMTLMTGASMPASFSTSRLSLVNRGVVYAISHVRGGADCGYDWYDARFIRCNVSVFLCREVSVLLCRSLYTYLGLFLTSLFSLLERGVVYAILHVHGSCDCGCDVFAVCFVWFNRSLCKSVGLFSHL